MGADKGIICFARINNPDKLHLDKNKFWKHDDYKFIREDEVDDFIKENEDDLVPDFRATITKAFALMHCKEDGEYE